MNLLDIPTPEEAHAIVDRLDEKGLRMTLHAIVSQREKLAAPTIWIDDHLYSASQIIDIWAELKKESKCPLAYFLARKFRQCWSALLRYRQGRMTP